MICRHCKKEFDNNLPSCPHCGFPVDRRANPVQRKSNSQESLWLKIIAVLSALFLAASVFAVVVTVVENNKSNDTHEAGDSNNKDNNKGNPNKSEPDTDTLEEYEHEEKPDPDEDFFEFGEYPQSEADEMELSQLKRIESTLGWNSLKNSTSNNIRYADYTLGGNKYRAIEMPNKEKPNEKIIRWFKFEPIQWIKVEVTSENDDGTKTTATHRISDKILDYGKFSTNVNFYGENDLNGWLNNEFYNSAFNENETNKLEKDLNNGVTLISVKDLPNNLSKAKPTDYARCLSDSDINVPWLLLDASNDASKNIITDDGKSYTPNTPAGIRPFIKLDQDNQ